MTRKKQDGNISMGMSFGSPLTNRYFLLLLVQALSYLLSQHLYSYLHWSEYSILTTGVRFLLHSLSFMHSLQELLGTVQPLSTVSSKEKTG
jgi:hypothetical protein